jgi:hypothetical protein
MIYSFQIKTSSLSGRMFLFEGSPLLNLKPKVA